MTLLAIVIFFVSVAAHQISENARFDCLQECYSQGTIYGECVRCSDNGLMILSTYSLYASLLLLFIALIKFSKIYIKRKNISSKASIKYFFGAIISIEILVLLWSLNTKSMCNTGHCGIPYMLDPLALSPPRSCGFATSCSSVPHQESYIIGYVLVFSVIYVYIILKALQKNKPQQ